MIDRLPKLRFSILLGGALTATARLRAQTAGSRVIAADSGMAHAAPLGLKPELWVGDFDSASRELQADNSIVRRETHPADKDKTDGEIAVDAALVRGARDLVLVGALGGQTDHALGHLALMLALARRGTGCFASSGIEEAYPLLPGQLTLDLPPGWRMSVIALSDLDGLDLAGVKWPLRAAQIAAGNTRTLSNITVGPVEIGLGAGNGLVIASLVPTIRST